MSSGSFCTTSDATAVALLVAAREHLTASSADARASTPALPVAMARRRSLSACPRLYGQAAARDPTRTREKFIVPFFRRWRTGIRSVLVYQGTGGTWARRTRSLTNYIWQGWLVKGWSMRRRLALCLNSPCGSSSLYSWFRMICYRLLVASRRGALGDWQLLVWSNGALCLG